jgi:hypothetical protein
MVDYEKTVKLHESLEDWGKFLVRLSDPKQFPLAVASYNVLQNNFKVAMARNVIIWKLATSCQDRANWFTHPYARNYYEKMRTYNLAVRNAKLYGRERPMNMIREVHDELVVNPDPEFLALRKARLAQAVVACGWDAQTLTIDREFCERFRDMCGTVLDDEYKLWPELRERRDGTLTVNVISIKKSELELYLRNIERLNATLRLRFCCASLNSRAEEGADHNELMAIHGNIVIIAEGYGFTRHANLWIRHRQYHLF